MTGMFELLDVVRARPVLPTPTRTRWQPLRMGLVDLFHYDSEEFWFRDGHLLLRGNSGTGKSKVLALTLPFLFDAQLGASRIEPDGDPGKRMAWNLLMGRYDRRIGYAWVEFGRVADDGTPRYLTLGAGLSAAAGRPQVESWFFLIEDAAGGPRLNEDLWLTSAQSVVLTKERLREALEGRGQIFETAASYRRAVDERLFRLGDARYAALMDTLIQLRQPQLSKKPDEANLSDALTEALPPLATDLLADVADALNQLEEGRRELEQYEALERAIGRFEQRYRIYAGTQSRRQARLLRQAQTEFDGASRTVNETQSLLQIACDSEADARAKHDQAGLELAGMRARLETLRSDPGMQDANRLELAAKEAAARRRALENAVAALETATERARCVGEETRQYETNAARAERLLAERRRIAAGLAEVICIGSQYAASPLAALDPASLVDLVPRAFEAAQSEMRALVTARRQQIMLLRQRRAELDRTETLHENRRQALDERRETATGAADRRQQADKDVESEGHTLVENWVSHLAGLRQLEVSAQSVLTDLSDWIAGLAGDNPARMALQVAQQHTSVRLAARRIELEGMVRTAEMATEALEDERGRLEAGEDTVPPVPYTRDAGIRVDRAGAPLWQLIEFRDHVGAAHRAGLEAALEAAGLLDAWVAPDAQLLSSDGRLLHDTHALLRPHHEASLTDWLRAAEVPDATVQTGIIERVLRGIACGEHDPAGAEAWIAPDGRFRLGALAGAWAKPSAVYIGFAARAAARLRRLAEIRERQDRLTEERGILGTQLEDCAQAESEAAEEWRGAPSDETLRHAHLAAATRAREFQIARELLAQADAQYREAEQVLRAARETFANTAADLRLPETIDALSAVEVELGGFDEAQQLLAQTAGELRTVLPELRRQQAREIDAKSDRQQREEEHSACRTETEETDVRLTVLREAVGAKVEELHRRLADAARARDAGEHAAGAAAATLRETELAHAVAAERAGNAATSLQQRAEIRTHVVGRLQDFAATGLLSAALPGIELPDLNIPWTIDPALTLARRAEQLLTNRNDSDEAWARIQRQINEDLSELQRSLTALGHQAPGETSDFGLVVHIVYQNRPERPDQLAARLAEEIAHRRELLTAREREVLENHLQAEIATAVQRLLQAAERQVDGINKELHKRPTSTGVRFRLEWLPMAEGAEAAPVGLNAARRRLLNTNADLWSAEDRNVVGAMLQQRIAAERERADAAGGGSLLDQLARALDYRRWHEFRVQRWQDGQWRKLSGPASSGERALGLTVPLFAAVASFYSQSGYAHSPRLVLLDEAFAGIDAAARAHCMALIREFDLDFVITSESEWACYAELPGVSICHLQRREGIDAVFVSRWAWNGRARLREEEPDRRFAIS